MRVCSCSSFDIAQGDVHGQYGFTSSPFPWSALSLSTGASQWPISSQCWKPFSVYHSSVSSFLPAPHFHLNGNGMATLLILKHDLYNKMFRQQRYQNIILLKLDLEFCYNSIVLTRQFQGQCFSTSKLLCPIENVATGSTADKFHFPFHLAAYSSARILSTMALC